MDFPFLIKINLRFKNEKNWKNVFIVKNIDFIPEKQKKRKIKKYQNYSEGDLITYVEYNNELYRKINFFNQISKIKPNSIYSQYFNIYDCNLLCFLKNNTLEDIAEYYNYSLDEAKSIFDSEFEKFIYLNDGLYKKTIPPLIFSNIILPHSYTDLIYNINGNYEDFDLRHINKKKGITPIVSVPDEIPDFMKKYYDDILLIKDEKILKKIKNIKKYNIDKIIHPKYYMKNSEFNSLLSHYNSTNKETNNTYANR